MKKSMTNELKEKIRQYIKNGIDISSLIANVDIRGEDLSRAIIKTFNRPDDDISNCNFCQAVIGENNKITNLNRVTANQCNFHRTKFLGTVWARNSTITNCNFKEADLSACDYKFTDFKGCNFCDAVIRIGSVRGTGTNFDSGFFKDLADSWGTKIVLEKEYNEFQEWKARNKSS